MTEDDKRAQAISFAYGNLVLDGSNATRRDVEKAMDRLEHSNAV